MKWKLFLLLLFGSIEFINAQNTLNVHCKDGSVVSYMFSEKPVVTYVTDGIHIATSKVDVDYPYSNLDKFTFSETADAIEKTQITNIKCEGTTRIYSLNGTLIKSVKSKDGTSSFSMDELPKGTYIIKNNTITYKILKK